MADHRLLSLDTDVLIGTMDESDGHHSGASHSSRQLSPIGDDDVEAMTALHRLLWQTKRKGESESATSEHRRVSFADGDLLGELPHPLVRHRGRIERNRGTDHSLAHVCGPLPGVTTGPANNCWEFHA